MQPIDERVSTALNLMRETQATLAQFLPETVPDETAAILQSTMLADCTGMHIGIRECLRAGVVTPAQILSRTLVTNSTVLSYMEANAPRAEELALRYVWSRLNREIKLVEDQERAWS